MKMNERIIGREKEEKRGRKGKWEGGEEKENKEK